MASRSSGPAPEVLDGFQKIWPGPRISGRFPKLLAWFQKFWTASRIWGGYEIHRILRCPSSTHWLPFFTSVIS
jgi:hypothetical protein